MSDPAAAHGRGGGPGSGFDTPPVAGGRVTAHDGAVLWVAQTSGRPGSAPPCMCSAPEIGGGPAVAVSHSREAKNSRMRSLIIGSASCSKSGYSRCCLADLILL